MRNLIPHFIYQHHQADHKQGNFEAASLYVDISGFTGLTETLMQHRKDGAEVLTLALNRVFNPLVQSVYAQGGFISAFAGDGFTALFPLNHNPAQQAVHAAFFIQQFFASHGDIQTKYGDFSLDAKISLGVGQVHWGILGQAGQHTYFFRGPAINACLQAQQCANAGDIVAAPEIAVLLQAQVTAEPIGTCFKLVASRIESIVQKPALKTLERDALSPFVLEAVTDLIGSGASAEFRQVAPVFISFDEIQDFDELNVFVSNVLELAADYGGYFNKLDYGDKGPVMLVLFGAPVAHENDLTRAADFLLALQSKIPWRAGLTFGTAYAGVMGGIEQCEYTAIGNVVNLASRLMTQADWGQILASESIAENKLLKVKCIGDLSYKGFSNPLPTYRLMKRQSHKETFFEQPLVGRQTELHQLLAAAQPILAGKFAGAAFIYGEAGIGKSHLAYEFRQALQQQSAVTCFIGQTDQILRQAFNPFSYLLKRYFDQLPDAAPDENKARFKAHLDRLLSRLDSLAPVGQRDPKALANELMRTQSILGALIGLHWPGSLYESLDGSLRYQNTLFAIKTLLLAESCLNPIVLELEDLSWLDQASQDAVTTLARNISDYPIFVVITSRYADDGSKPTLALAEDIPTTSIDLNALTQPDLRRLAEIILNGPITNELLSLLLERTQANPFFAQQFLYYFHENGLLEQLPGGAWTIKANIPADLPTTINAILIARIDRLAQDVKEVVKAAAVLGREFDDRILARMLQADVTQEVNIAEQEQIWSRAN